MRKLTREQQAFIVSELACFATPQEVADSFYVQFGDRITRQAVQEYDPEGSKRRGVGRRWKMVHDKVRETFLTEISRIGITHRAYRMRKLQLLCDELEARGNLAGAAHILELAAKEMGNFYFDGRRVDPPTQLRLITPMPRDDIARQFAHDLSRARERAYDRGKGVLT